MMNVIDLFSEELILSIYLKDIETFLDASDLGRSISNKRIKNARTALGHLKKLFQMELDVKGSTENGCQGPDRGSGIICE